MEIFFKLNCICQSCFVTHEAVYVEKSDHILSFDVVACKLLLCFSFK